MAPSRKSWNEKLHVKKDLPKVVDIDEKLVKRFGPGTMVVPSPVEVDEIMQSVPAGHLITTDQIRRKLAEKHGTNTACPLCTGMFAKIAAFAAEENRENGKEKITPYWRTLKSQGELNDKFPGGIDQQKWLLENEGFVVVKKGKKYYVENYEQYLAE
jgi:hypothetical protein